MLITKEIILKINSRNIDRLKDLGYTNLKRNEKVVIPVEHLSIGSKHKVDVKCDICFNNKTIDYKSYNYSLNKHGFYTCNGKCANLKREMTSTVLFGHKSWMKDTENVKLYKEKLLKTTGYSNNFSNPLAQQKHKDNMMMNYGVEFISQVPEFYKNQQISGFKMKMEEETGLYYRGTYELDFILKFKHLGLKSGPRFKYFSDKEHYYFSDFLIESLNIVVEIKSSYYWEKYLQTNLLKRKSCLNEGYNYYVLIDKDYESFKFFIENINKFI